MAFTTWAALKKQMQDDMASGSWRRQSYSVSGRTTTYTTFVDFQKALEYVTAMADQEAAPAARRTIAKNGGGGRW